MATRLERFTGSEFIGNTVRVDIEFFPALQKVNTYAAQAGVKVHVTSSFRCGAIQATMSNHMVGHAIDMNVRFNGRLYTRNDMNSFSSLPAAVKTFLNKVRNDPDLRWGGDFTPIDSVHIDDGLNVSQPTVWSQKRQFFVNNVCS